MEKNIYMVCMKYCSLDPHNWHIFAWRLLKAIACSSPILGIPSKSTHICTYVCMVVSSCLIKFCTPQKSEKEVENQSNKKDHKSYKININNRFNNGKFGCKVLLLAICGVA